MKKKLQRRRRKGRRKRDTFHFQKFTFPLSFNRFGTQHSLLVVCVVRQTQRPLPESFHLREVPNLRDHARSALLSNTPQEQTKRLAAVEDVH